MLESLLSQDVCIVISTIVALLRWIFCQYIFYVELWTPSSTTILVGGGHDSINLECSIYKETLV